MGGGGVRGKMPQIDANVMIRFGAAALRRTTGALPHSPRLTCAAPQENRRVAGDCT
jgi:hypothetical protein